MVNYFENVRWEEFDIVLLSSVLQFSLRGQKKYFSTEELDSLSAIQNFLSVPEDFLQGSKISKEM